MILSMFQLAQVIFSPMIAEVAGKYGRKKVLILGQVIMAASTICFGFLSYVRDADVFYASALFLRLM
jgi:MFS family permease